MLLETEEQHGRRGYQPEFRRRVLGLIETGRTIADVSRDLDLSLQTIYAWRHKDRIDRGLGPGTSSTEHATLTAEQPDARAQGQTRDRPPIARTAQGAAHLKGRLAAIKVMVADGLPVQVACHTLQVSVSGYYAALTAPPSERVIRHAWLTDVIVKIYAESRETYRAGVCTPS